MVKFVLEYLSGEKNENKQKEAGFGPLKRYFESVFKVQNHLVHLDSFSKKSF